jgi:hypothetical protein
MGNNSSEIVVNELLVNLPAAIEEQIEELLIKIECPPDFRGLKSVITLLESLSQSHPKAFQTVFAFNSQNFQYFHQTTHKYEKNYTKQTLAKGSKSERPIYSLLATIALCKQSELNAPLLLFLSHYFNNESTIKNLGREEQSVRAFRLLITDQKFDLSTLNESNISQAANNVESYRQELMDNEDENFKHLINYCRELVHFFQLDWNPKYTRSSGGSAKIRPSYSRKKIERIIGSDNLFTLSQNNLKSSPFNEDNGLAGVEETPALAIIKQEPLVNERPSFEKPDISTIEDFHKRKIIEKSITKDIRRSHNLTLLARTIMQPYELKALYNGVLSYRGRFKQRTNQCKALIMLSLFLGRDIQSLCELRWLPSKETDGSGVFIAGGKCYLKVVVTPTAQTGRHNSNQALLKIKSYISIELPKFISKYLPISEIPRSNLAIRIFWGNKIEGILDLIQKILKYVNEKYSVQISLKKITHFIKNLVIADGNYDPVLLEYLTGELAYYTRAMRHYIWYREEEINSAIWGLWHSIFNCIDDEESQVKSAPAHLLNSTNSSIGVGSQFTPTDQSLQRVIEILKNDLLTKKSFEVQRNLKNLVQYHNSYTLYTLYMMINATGYRAVYNPLPIFNLHLSRYGLMCISDKDELNSFSNMRIVCLPHVLQKQLEFYIEHVNAMANFVAGFLPYEAAVFNHNIADNPFMGTLNKKQRNDQFYNLKHSRSNNGTFILFDHARKYQSKNAHPKLLKELTPDAVDLPLNFGRHYLRRYLQLHNVNQELINFQLGHHVNGELPLSKYSSFSHIEASQELNQLLENMMSALGWTDVPSLLTRKRL